jgi:hypothetical protein
VYASSPSRRLTKEKDVNICAYTTKEDAADHLWAWHWRDESLSLLKSLSKFHRSGGEREKENEQNLPVAVLAMPSEKDE